MSVSSAFICGSKFHHLWSACLASTRPQLDSLAQRLNPKATWDDIVLPPEQTNLLHQIADQIRQRSQVYQNWGFDKRMNRGMGISALFAGESGTGKTMAAEVIANDLHTYRATRGSREQGQTLPQPKPLIGSNALLFSGIPLSLAFYSLSM